MNYLPILPSIATLPLALAALACDAAHPLDEAVRAPRATSADPNEPAADGAGNDELSFQARLTPRDDGRCLDAQLDVIRDAPVEVELWECTGLPQQLWMFSLAADEDGWRIQSAGDPSRCLDSDPQTAVNLLGERAVVQLWTCDDQDRQLWLLQGNGKIQNLLQARRDVSFGFMDAALTTPDSGGLVQLWTAREQSNQSWERLPP